MEKTIIFFIVLFSLQAQSIINAEIALEKQMSSAVYIWSLKENKVQFRCSGSLIAPDVVLTETSCIYDDKNDKRGDTFLISNSYKYHYQKPLADLIKSVVANVRSDAQHPSENLILLFLNQAVPMTPAVILQPEETHELISIKSAQIAGWGFSSPPLSHDILTQFRNFLQDFQDQRSLGTKHVGISHIGSQTDRYLELGYLAQDALACTGDEGGPVIVSLKNNTAKSDRLVAIISSRKNLKSCVMPTYGLRLDKLVGFIQDQLEWACQKGIRSWCDIQGLISPEFGIDQDREAFKTTHHSSPELEPIFPSISPQKKPPSFPKIRMPTSAQKKTGKNNLKIKMDSQGCSCSQIRS